MDRTATVMPDLADFLARELDHSSYRALEAKTKVSRGALENIIQRENKKLPELETLNKIADAYGLALWQVIEMTGIDLGLPKSPSDLAQRLTALAGRMPEIEPIVRYLLKLHPADLHGVVMYLEVADRQRNANQP